MSTASPQTEAKVITRRQFKLEEVQSVYASRQVYDHNNCFLLRPLSEAEGPVFLEIPSNLPLDRNGQPLDLTQPFADWENRITDAFKVDFDRGEVYLRLGQAGPGDLLHKRLLLDDTQPYDAMEIMIYHRLILAWGGTKMPQLPPWTDGEVLLSERVYLPNLSHIDYILLHVSQAPKKVRATLDAIWKEHLEEIYKPC